VVTTTTAPSVKAVHSVLASVTDPEIPAITIADLGILRGVEVDGGRITVTITPTYSGCPAIAEIEADVRTALAQRGWSDVTVRTVLSPAWTTDWMTEDGRRKLREFGIAPPSPRTAGPVLVQLGPRPQAVQPDVACPHCGSAQTEELTRFASTSCKALWRCGACREPFDYFKAH
jgi:ring-1,2-phenylacetyl-CoA epoxidase subunit PaaD